MWGPGSNEPTQTLFFAFTMMWNKVHFGPQIGIQRFTTCKKNKIYARGNFVCLLFAWFCENSPEFLDKNSQQTLIEYAQKHFKSVLGKPPKSAEKNSK